MQELSPTLILPDIFGKGMCEDCTDSGKLSV